MSFTDEQISKLKEPLILENIKTREAFGTGKLSYIAGFHAIAEANRIFGHGGWSTEIVSMSEVSRTHYIKPPFKSNESEKPQVAVGYMCQLKITVGDVSRNDVGWGDGIGADTPSGLHNAIELASKESVTDAIKRCLRSFGDQFGNSLYEKDAPAPIDAATYEASKVIDADQLQSLRDLLSEREIDDEWALVWLSAEGFTEPLEALRQDWYEAIYKAADAVGLEQREAEDFIARYDNLTKLMKESVNMNMLKATFTDAWKLSTKHKDKDRQKQAQSVYEEIKVKFEDKK